MSTVQYNFPSTAVSIPSFPLPTNASTASNQTDGSQKTQIVDGSGNVIGSTSNALNVALTAGSVTLVNGLVSTANSSTTPLAINASFTGTGADITNYSAVEIMVATDRNGVLNMQFSSDGTNWDHDDAHACTVTTGGVVQSFYFQSAPIAKYFRVKYDNGGTAQGVFRLQTVFKVNAGVGDVQDLSTAPVDASNGMITKSVIYGKTTGGGGGYVAVKTNPSGSLAVACSQDTSPWVVSGTVAATQSGTWNVGLNAGTNLVGKFGIDQTTNGTTNAVYVNNFPATQTVSGTVAATQSGTWNIGTVSTITNPVAVTGTFYQATQPVSGTVTVSSITNALPTGTNTIGSVKQAGLAIANTPVYNAYTSTSVTTSAYVQLIASTTSAATMVQIFDSSGQAMIIATGAAGSEVNQLYVPPGGADFNLAIAAGTRVSIKALTATASSGYLLVNLLG
jgi:hypothetical protein